MPAKVCFALILAGICVIVVPLYKRSVTLALLNMRIANPIYDVVFKYLMDDNKIARLIISSIINEEIEELELRPLEVSGNLQQNEKKTENSGDQETPPVSLSLTVYRLDFSAKIRTPQGIKTVIIEIQKTKFPTDNLRFRKYLSSQYASNENAHKVLTGGRLRTTGIPIISIYFLGHKLDATTACAIGVKRVYVDLITNEPIQQKEVFIESLTHDSYIIQIPFLTPQRRNDLEILLSVFDQSKAIDARRHILNIKEEEFPEKFRPIIRKLQKAIQNKQVKQKMDMEDTLIDELTEMELTIRKLEAENKLAKLLIEQERQQNEAAQLLIEQERQQIEAAQFIIEQERQQKEAAQLLIEQERQQKEAAQLLIEQERQQKEAAQLLIEQERQQKEAAQLLIEQERQQKEAAQLKEQLAEEKIATASKEIEQLKQKIAQLLKDKKD